MNGRAVEGRSYAEAWCENCGWRCQEPEFNDAMDAAEDHSGACAVERPSIRGQKVELFTVIYPKDSTAGRTVRTEP